MKLTLKAVLVTLVCAGFAQVVCPEIVRVKLYKTDPTTWNKPYYYNLSNRLERITIETPIISAVTKGNASKRAKQAQQTDKITKNRPHVFTMPKSIKKDGAISFDDQDFNMLFVCSKSLHEPNPGECGKLILSLGDNVEIASAAEQQYPLVKKYTPGDVIAIGKDMQLISMPKSDVDTLIKDNQAKFFKIPVYKTDPETWNQKWTITLVDEDRKPYPEAQTIISQDSAWTKKLLIRKDITEGTTYVQVRKPKGLYIVETLLVDPQIADWENQILVIDGQGNARIMHKSLDQATPKVPKKLRQERLSEQGIPLSDLPAV